MDLPKIDLASLPGLDSAQGLYGSVTQATGRYEDSIIGVMVYVYDVSPPPGIIG